MRCRLRVGARWIALAGGVILESVAGTPYAFGVFAPALKDKLHYTQAQIDAVGSVGNIGQYTAIMAGLVYDSLGPRITGVGGAALSLLGYGFLWSASAGLTGGSPAATSGAAFFAFMGASWFDQLAVCAAAENFPRDAGVAIGLTKSLLGLSASLCTTAYQNLFEPDVTRYLGFLALCVPAVGLIFSSLVTVVRNPHLLLPLSRAEATKVGCAYAVVVLTAVYVAVVGLLQSTGSIGPRPVIAYVVVPLVLAQLLLACPVPSSESPPTSGQRLLLEEDNDPMRYTADTTPLDSPLLQMTINEATDCIERRAATVSESLRAPAAPAGAPFAGALLCLDFWLVFIVLTVGTGAGLTVINNVASLGESLGGGQPTQDLLVTLTSIANCVGRMAGGAASDGLARWLHRPGWLACNVALMAVAQVGVGFFFLQGSPPLLSFTPTLQAALAVSPLAYVYPGILLAGFSYGAFWALSPAFLADRVGPRAYGAVTATSALSAAVGSYALSAGMAASLYEASIGPGGGTECVGRRCFGGSFVALAVLCAGVALPFAAWLALRTRLLYRSCGESVGYDAYEGLVGPEARWKRQLRRRCYACCCCAWGEGLVGDSHEFEDGPQEVTRD